MPGVAQDLGGGFGEVGEVDGEVRVFSEMTGGGVGKMSEAE